MRRHLVIPFCLVPALGVCAPATHSADYYFTHPQARVALEMQCYPGLGNSAAGVDCRNAWTAGQRIVHSVVKPRTSAASSEGATWGDIERMTAPIRPVYPNAPEEQRTNPAYWRLRGLNKIKDYVFSCPAHPTAKHPTCEAARAAQAAPWRPTYGAQR